MKRPTTVIKRLKALRVNYSNERRNEFTSSSYFAIGFLIFARNWKLEDSDVKMDHLEQY